MQRLLQGYSLAVATRFPCHTAHERGVPCQIELSLPFVLILLPFLPCSLPLLSSFFFSLSQPLLPALARFTVARPLAKPTPFPLVPRLLNIGAFLNMSGTMKNRT